LGSISSASVQLLGKFACARGTSIALLSFTSRYPDDGSIKQTSGERKRFMATFMILPCDYLTIPLRLTLALSFLFSVADRLGILGPPGAPGVSWGNFANFLTYSAQVNSFAPAALQPPLGIVATIFESLFGFALLIGIYTRAAALAAGALLFAFGCAMAISFGIKSPFDYSVFTAMSGSLFLAASNDYPFSADAIRRWFMRRRHTRDLELHITARTEDTLR
jgi:uncharacterized membrane protein YphA (DoxX/SURF4 family)